MAAREDGRHRGRRRHHEHEGGRLPARRLGGGDRAGGDAAAPPRPRRGRAGPGGAARVRLREPSRGASSARAPGGDGVAAIAVSGQMAGVLGIDRDWRPVDAVRLVARRPLRAAAPPARRRARRSRRPRARAARRCSTTRRRCSGGATSGRPRTPDTAAFVMPGVYVAGVLAGLSAADAFIDRTYLHFTGVADARSATWSPELLAALGLDGEQAAADRGVATRWSGELTACGRGALRPARRGPDRGRARRHGGGRAGRRHGPSRPAARHGGDGRGARRRRGRVQRRPGAGPDRHGAARCRTSGCRSTTSRAAGCALPWLAAARGGHRRDRRRARRHAGGAARRGRRGAAGRRRPRLHPAPRGPDRAARARPCAAASSGSASPTGAPQLARAILEAVAFEYATYLRAMRRLHPGGRVRVGPGHRRRRAQRAVERDQGRRARRAGRAHHDGRDGDARRRAARRVRRRARSTTSARWPRPCPRPRSWSRDAAATSATPRWSTATTA